MYVKFNCTCLIADGLEVEEPLVLVDREEGEVGEDEGEGPRQQQDHAVAVAGRGGQLEPPLDLLNGWKNQK